MLADRVKILKPSPTLQLAALAKELQAQGHKVISMSVGEPDWTTFEYIKDAAKTAIDQNHTKYTENVGLLELREAIARQVEQDFKVTYKPNEVLVSSGAKYSLYLATQCLLNSGDEVILPAPYWVSYAQQVELAGGVPKIVICDESSHFKLTASQLKSAITPKTKMIILCSPSNPTGLMYTREEIKQLAAVLKQNPHVFVLSDDIYNRLVFEGEELAPHLLQEAPELKDRLLIVNGVSKTYAMTGWRIGWAIGPQALIKAMGDLQSQSTSNAASISQKAAIAAVKGGYEDVKKSVVMLKQRLAVAAKELANVNSVKPVFPDGAFYLWLDIRSFMGKNYNNVRIENSRDFSTMLLKDFFVAVVPGLEFGLDGYLRLSIALSEKDIVEAIHRIKSFTEKIH